MEFAEALKSLVKDCVSSNGLMCHHIDSFNHFIDVLIPNIIEELGDFSVAVKTGGRHHIVFSNPVFDAPTVRNSDHRIYPLWPTEALQRKLTYAIGFYVDIVHKLIGEDNTVVFHRKYSHYLLCSIPCMIGSTFCYLRQRQPELFCSPSRLVGLPTGYFIVSGQEKALISQEAMRTNWPCVSIQAAGVSARCEVRSLHCLKWRSTSTLNINLSRNQRKGISLTVMVPFVAVPVDLCIVFIGLGVDDPKTMVRLCGGDVDFDLHKLFVSQKEAFCDKMLLPRDTPSFDKTVAFDYIAHLHGKINFATADPNAEQDVLDIVSPAVDCDNESDGDTVSTGDTSSVELKTAHRQVSHIFDVEFFPHIGFDSSTAFVKARFLGVCIAKLIRVFQGTQEPDDRDQYQNKRIQPAGVLLAVLFRQLMRRMLNQMALHLGKISAARIHFEHIINFCEIKQLTTSLRYSLATGNWGILKAGCSVVGVSQPLYRDSRTGTLSQLRRFNTSLNRDGKQPKPRQLYESQWGVVCPCETPEGKSSGLVKALALLALTQISVSAPTLIKYLFHYIKEPTLIPIQGFMDFPSQTTSFHYVFVSGIIVGITRNKKQLLSQARKLKRFGYISRFVSVGPSDCGVHINCDAGTLTRPVFHLPSLRKWVQDHGFTTSLATPGSWSLLLKLGIICYMDKFEDSYKRVAPNVITAIGDSGGYKYAEIHPSSFLGLSANMIPFSQMNQAPRNIYSTCMSKQAMGIPHLDFLERADPTSYVLCYPQRPLVETMGDHVASTVSIPGGCNAVVLIATYDGWNMEDAVVFNKASVQRGLYHLNIFRTYSDEISNNTAEAQRFGAPNVAVTQAIRAVDYSKLDPEDGLLSPGERVLNGDPVIGKVVTMDPALGNGAVDRTPIDRSTIAKHPHDTAFVHSCAFTTTPNNNRLAHVTTVSLRPVSVGDKFASRHAQKGVCSILANPEDMPFSVVDGMVPDIIISPHAIPSRMTIAQLLESIVGKNAALTGKIADATAFVQHDIGAIKRSLESQGFRASGKQQFRDGKTGALLQGELFMGIVYYNRLKHMVKDKLHARATGPVHDLTRQPPHGRGRTGGFRLGEMERDAMIAHGAAAFLNDRYVKNSDEFKTVYCKKCGQFAVPARPFDAKYSFNAHEAFCKLCESSENVVPITLPYCYKLLTQELQAMNIYTKIFPQ